MHHVNNSKARISFFVHNVFLKKKLFQDITLIDRITLNFNRFYMSNDTVDSCFQFSMHFKIMVISPDQLSEIFKFRDFCRNPIPDITVWWL